MVLILISEIFGYAIIKINRIPFALILTTENYTYPHTAQQMLKFVETVLPPLPIIILSPRVGGYSKAYSTFNIDKMLPKINVDKVAWKALPLPKCCLPTDLPF
jgi:hypothetical protein